MRYSHRTRPNRPLRGKVLAGQSVTKGATMVLLQARGVVQARGKERVEKARERAQEEAA